MLLTCPECRKQFSETADACPKCGFKVDPSTKALLKAAAVKWNRNALTVLAIVLLVFSTPCLFSIFGSHEGHYIGVGRREEAFSKLQRGELLSDSDVYYLAEGADYVSSTEEKEASWTMFWFGTVLLVLPATGIFLYLVLTRQQVSGLQVKSR